MGSERQEVTLADASLSVQTGPFGSQLHKSDYVEEGIPSIMPVNIADNRITTESIARISEEDAERLSKYRVEPGDVVYSRRGDVERRALVREAEDGWLCGTGCLRIRFDKELVDPEYASFQLGGAQCREWIVRHAIGATMPNLNTSILSAVPFILPPLPEQKAIAHILGTLDDKIELNRRMNATLEGMAQALFKSWFVDLDPVIDNALAAGNPIPDELASRAEVRKKALANGTTQQGSVDHPTLSDPQSLFPAAFEYYDELGPIPEGWETQPLYDIADFVNGAAYKGADFSDAEAALPVIKIAEVKAGITGQTKFTTNNKGDKYRVEDGDILLSWSGNPDTSIDTFIWTNGPGYLNQHIFNVRLHDESERYFVYYQLKYLRSTFAELARDKQTTGLGHFTAGDMKRLMVFKPTATLLDRFNRAVSSIYSRGYENRLSTETLTKLRDTLLPKLISKEIRLSDTSELVEDVAG